MEANEETARVSDYSEDESVRLHIVIDGHGPTMVLIHGVIGSYRIWDRITPYLEPRYRLVRIDLLGYGRSPRPHVAYTPTTHVETIRRTLHLANITPRHMC